ncbi:hypothetical protein FRC09_001529 [Ceratobasidium sp. 395]|nr:hypothetical protein FRC09_001529 [Ceratobasidium sp. 395]
MSEELAQDDDAEDYDLESMQRRGAMAPPSQENLAGGIGGREALRQDEVVFEIGDEDDDDDKERRRGEREGLMSKDRND